MGPACDGFGRRGASGPGRWAERAQNEEVRNWLRSTQGFATIRAGEVERGMAQLERLDREAEERDWDDVVYHRNDLAEGCLMAGRPERTLDLLLSLGEAANGFILAKAHLALGRSRLSPFWSTCGAARTTIGFAPKTLCRSSGGGRTCAAARRRVSTGTPKRKPECMAVIRLIHPP